MSQVGSVRALINSKGKIVKRIDYDSFGNVLSDSLSKLFIPQGFASGMTDPYTGLTKFGHRYYDPRVGRFVTLDPAKDRRGDNDLYDYCADDPVNRVDRDGRFFFALPLILGKLGALGLGAAGAYGAASLADKVQSERTGEESSKAVDAVNTVAPDVALTVGSTAIPTVPRALDETAGLAIKGAGKVLDKLPASARKPIDFAINTGTDFYGAAATPSPPALTLGGTAGVTYGAWPYINNKYEKAKSWLKEGLNK